MKTANLGIIRWGAFASIVANAIACGGGVVDLGGDHPNVAVEPGTSILRSFDTDLVATGGLAVDHDYLYLTTLSGGTQSPAGYAVQRCDKSECSTITPVAGLDHDDIKGLQLSKDRIGFMHTSCCDAHLQVTVGRLSVCLPPDCRELRDVVEGLPEPGGMVLDATDVYWALPADNSVYRCSLPGCDRGPEIVATGSIGLDLSMNDDTLYWIGFGGEIWRSSKERGGQLEALAIGPGLHRIDSTGLASEKLPWASQAQSIAVDATWLYAVSCTLPASECDILRFPAHGYGQGEILAHAEGSPDIALFDGELVVSEYRDARPGKGTTLIWSCRADACASTARPLARDTSIPFVRSRALPAVDDQYVYFLTASPSFSGGYTEVRRAPRLR